MGSMSAETHDFIVVGAGAAGSILAYRLAHSKQRPSVLLIEAGGKNDDLQARVSAERWMSLKMHPKQNWSYKTVPQTLLNDRLIDYDRGKGLGGSTAINFCAWTIAGQDDHDELARVVGDPVWKWENAQKRYKRIENYHGGKQHVPSSYSNYLDPKPEHHGSSGPIKIGFPQVIEDSFTKEMEILTNFGFKVNKDMNDGDQIGIAPCPNTAFAGIRSTAADALVDAPANLQVVTDSQVARVIFEGKVAIGVESLHGTLYCASKEVILSCGSIDTPKVLMHSGIGPAEQLQKLGIPVVDDNKYVGQNLQEHPMLYTSWPRRDPSHNRADFYRNPDVQKKAQEQWAKDQTGPLAEMACLIGMGYLKHDKMFETAEFQDLPQEKQRLLKAPTTPHFEFCFNLAHLDHITDLSKAPSMVSYVLIGMNPQSRGQVFLSSANPADPISIDLNMMSHPYDKRLLIETMRILMKAANVEPDSTVDGTQYSSPASDSEEDILDYARAALQPTWHATGTVKMGASFEEADACVNPNFQVRGVSRLRAADMSIVPVIPNNHTQATAYLVGLTAGDKLVAEYRLDE